jgi:hypothetical protein
MRVSQGLPLSEAKNLPEIVAYGWEVKPEGGHQPVKCLLLPAPQASLENVNGVLGRRYV